MRKRRNGKRSGCLVRKKSLASNSADPPHRERFDDIASRHRDAPLPGDDVGQVGYMSRFRVVFQRGVRGLRPEPDLEPRSVCEWPTVHWGKCD